jgi:hypothetical protein
MPRNKAQKPQRQIRVIELSPFHTDLLAGFVAAWKVTESQAIAALLHAVYSTIQTQSQHPSPIQTSLKSILRKVHHAQSTTKG